jgi:hypothetical protein
MASAKPNPTVSEEDWLAFVEKYYQKTFRSEKDRTYVEFKADDWKKLTPNNLVIYPDITDNHQFYAIVGSKISWGGSLLRFDNKKLGLRQLIIRDDKISEIASYEFQVDITMLEKMLTDKLTSILKPNYRGRGGKRRSRKAKKNKAHTPQ